MPHYEILVHIPWTVIFDYISSMVCLQNGQKGVISQNQTYYEIEVYINTCVLAGTIRGQKLFGIEMLTYY